jgi:DnaJ-class molecular chaperone
MAKQSPLKQAHHCPGCRGTRRNLLSVMGERSVDPCEYCEGRGYVSERRFDTLVRFLGRRALVNKPTLH